MNDSKLTFRENISLFKHLLRIFWEWTLGFKKDPDTLKEIRIEVSSVCQLRCPLCPQVDGQLKEHIGFGFLEFANFKKLVDENPEIKSIEISNWGEIFLNPELNDILAYSHKKGVSLTAFSGVNLNTVNEETLEDIVKYQLKGMLVSLDGASPETYRQYRVKGNFNTVIANIQKINEFKKKYNSPFPVLNWQFIIFKHNEHEISKAKALAKKLNMSFFIKKNWGESNPSNTTSSSFKKRPKIRDRIQPTLIATELCGQMWESPQINWDGKLLGCCVNKWGDYGNVFEQGLKSCLQNPKYIHAKRALLGREKITENMPCYSCWHPPSCFRLLRNPLLVKK